MPIPQAPFHVSGSHYDGYSHRLQIGNRGLGSGGKGSSEAMEDEAPSIGTRSLPAGQKRNSRARKVTNQEAVGER